MPTYKGQCLCGSIQYEVDKIEARIGHCHCSMCRKFHGAAFATFGEAKRKNFHWVAGEKMLQSYHAQNGTTRQFCRQCGSSMTFAPSNDDGELVEFSLATLDSDIPLKPDAHIYFANKANWLEIADDLPKFEGDRENRRLRRERKVPRRGD